MPEPGALFPAFPGRHPVPGGPLRLADVFDLDSWHGPLNPPSFHYRPVLPRERSENGRSNSTPALHPLKSARFVEAGRHRSPFRELDGVNDLKTLFASRLVQTGIKRVEPMASRMVLRPAKRGPELQGICRTKRVPKKNAFRIVAHLLRGKNFAPTLAEELQALASLIGSRRRQGRVTLSTRDGREAFDRGTPPDANSRIGAEVLSATRRGTTAEVSQKITIPSIAPRKPPDGLRRQGLPAGEDPKALPTGAACPTEPRPPRQAR